MPLTKGFDYITFYIDIMKKKLTPYFLYFTCMKYLSGSVINPLQIGFLQAMYLFASLLPSPLIPSYWLPFKHSKKNTPNMEGNLLSSPYVRERKYTFRVLNNNPHKKKTVNFDSGIVFPKRKSVGHSSSTNPHVLLPTQYAIETKPVWKNPILKLMQPISLVFTFPSRLNNLEMGL